MTLEDASSQLSHWLGRFQAGEEAARDALFRHCDARLRRMTHRMLSTFPALHGLEQTDDVYNNAALKLAQDLGQMEFQSSVHFLSVAARYIRRELIGLKRHYGGPLGILRNQLPPGEGEKAVDERSPEDPSEGPLAFLEMEEVHRQIDQLPEEHRVLFDLLFYQGLAQAEAAALLEVSPATLKRHWLKARLHLAERLRLEKPK